MQSAKYGEAVKELEEAVRLTRKGGSGWQNLFLALAYHKEKRLPVIVVRLFNTVGPRQTGRYGMVIPNFVKQALLGHPLTVFGDGSQSLCFTFVTDVVEGLLRLVGSDGAVGQVFNIGNDREEISILDLARRVKAGPIAEPSAREKVIQSVASLAFLAIFVVAGFVLGQGGLKVLEFDAQ